MENPTIHQEANEFLESHECGPLEEYVPDLVLFTELQSRGVIVRGLAKTFSNE